MLLNLKLLSFANKILIHNNFINDLLIDYKIEVIGRRKELVLIYKTFDLKTICDINHLVKYEPAFIRAEYNKGETLLYFTIPNHLYYLIDSMQNRIIDVFAKEELNSIESFYNNKSLGCQNDNSGFFYLFFFLDFFFLES